MLNTLMKHDSYESYCMGDFNINYLDKKAPVYRSLKYFENINVFNQYIDTATRVTELTSTCIDLLFANRDEVIASCGVIDNGISDHSLIFVQRKLVHTQQKARFIRARIFRNFDPGVFRNQISNLNWDEVLNEYDPNAAWEIFKKLFVGICDQLAPYGTIRVRGRLPAWVNDDYLSITDARDKAKKTFNRSKLPLDNYVYKTLRNSANTLANNLKKSYIADAIDSSKNNVKKLWKTLRLLIPSKKKQQDPNIEINGSTDPETIAEDFNEIFCNVGSNLADQIPDVSMDLLPDIIGNGNLFSFTRVDVPTVTKLLANINQSKSTGLDGINPRFLKICYDLIAEPITHIINASLMSGLIPLDWKVARVSPLYKDGSRNKILNYRPISVLPIMGKILERLVHEQVYDFFTRNNLFDKNQAGFRSGHSTVSCALSVLDHVYLSLDRKQIVGIVFLDLKKAFDTVDYHILCQKLAAYGVVGSANAWFRNYLSNRKQVTRYKGKI